jgi:hypothetical protein
MSLADVAKIVLVPGPVPGRNRSRVGVNGATPASHTQSEFGTGAMEKASMAREPTGPTPVPNVLLA